MSQEWEVISDPERLFHLKKQGWEIEVFQWDRWEKWKVLSWSNTLEYRASPRQPKMKKVKMLCYLVDNHRLAWLTENASKTHGLVRIPAQDIEIEVPDDN